IATNVVNLLYFFSKWKAGEVQRYSASLVQRCFIVLLIRVKTQSATLTTLRAIKLEINDTNLHQYRLLPDLIYKVKKLFSLRHFACSTYHCMLTLLSSKDWS